MFSNCFYFFLNVSNFFYFFLFFSIFFRAAFLGVSAAGRNKATLPLFLYKSWHFFWGQEQPRREAARLGVG